MKLIDYIAPGDIVTLDKTGYAAGKPRKYKVTRKSGKSFFVRYNDVAEGKINEFGMLLPRDKYINTYVTHVNGISVEEIEAMESTNDTSGL